jgi:hypothetical protein
MAGAGLVDVLGGAGVEVYLADLLGVWVFSCRRVENGERGAADVADLLRMGRLPGAWIAPAEVRELREITRDRRRLVKGAGLGQGPGPRGAGQARHSGRRRRYLRRAGNTWLDGLDLPRPYAGKAAAGRGAGRRDHPGGHGARRSAGRACGMCRDPAAAGHRPGAGRGHRGRDRRHRPGPRAWAAGQLGRADAPGTTSPAPR